MYQELWSQNDFWHVPQTCPDVRHATVSPARFLGVDQALGTCASDKLRFRALPVAKADILSSARTFARPENKTKANILWQLTGIKVI